MAGKSACRSSLSPWNGTGNAEFGIRKVVLGRGGRFRGGSWLEGEGAMHVLAWLLGSSYQIGWVLGLVPELLDSERVSERVSELGVVGVLLRPAVML